MSDLYRMGEYEIDVKRRQIRRDGEVVPLAQKPFEVLLVLIGGAGGVVTKEELMQAIWPNAFVEESNLAQSVFLLRKALGDSASGRRYVLTLPGVGYQLGVAAVAVSPAATSEPDEALGKVVGTVPAVPKARTGGIFRRPTFLLVGLLAMVVVVLAGWEIRRMLRPASFTNFSMRRLTNSGDVQATAISRSGRYVATVARDAQGRESLSVLELHSGNSHVIVDDASLVFEDILFSPDESYVYYRGHERKGSAGVSSEYRIPLLGGEPTLVVRDIDGPVAFLDGGQRVCFLRGEGESQFAVLSADADSGGHEQTLAKGSDPFPATVVCSPDGQRAAISSEVGGITMLDFKTGERRPFYEATDSGEIYPEVSWKADGSGLIANVVTPFNLYPALISISYPGAERTQITHDLSSYHSPGMTADESMIVARQVESNTHFESFSLPLNALNPEVISFPWTDFLGWRSDEEIVGSTTLGGLKMKDLGTSKEVAIQIPRDMKFLQPNGCGGSLLIASGGHPAEKSIAVWRMNADGSGLKQLSRGPEDILAVCTADAKWVVYADNSALRKASIYRVSVEGGTPVKVGEGSVWFAVSRDSERVAWVQRTDGRQSLVIAELRSGRRLASLAMPETVKAVRSLTFAADDKSVFYIARGDASDSIYELPLDGAAASKQIEFRGARLATVMVSPGAKYLGVVTTKPVSDAVLLEERSR
jgi:DNA-binding winged helix-turn-helix (wHTH) protein/Tol biopolymer transport system component